MNIVTAASVAALLAVAASACADSRDEDESYAPAHGIRLVEIVTGLDAPLWLTAPADDQRLFIVEQPGRVLIFESGRLRAAPFLDIRDRVRSGGEQGLLSLAFHPRYGENGYFFVNYTDHDGDTIVERYTVSADSNAADPGSAKLVLEVDQPYSNHNGGLVLFGPDGMLYIGMGDGGSGGDPHGNGQNRATLLGDLLRIDIDTDAPYAIPPDNPFIGRFRGEIWAWGLRNPWRFCFDRAEDLLYIADVGQSRWEEVDVAPAGSAGLNYGWNIMEGGHPYPRGRGAGAGLTKPVLEYSHEDGCSITGGFVYRGSRMPAVAGHYFFSDYCTGWLRSFRYAGGRATEKREWQGASALSASSFGEDSAGEMYLCSLLGAVYRLEWDEAAGSRHE